MTESKSLKISDVFKFWLPLATNWQIMACESPLLTALIARLPNEKYNLAAFGVSWAISLFFESPVISLLSTTAALAQDRASYLKLRRFMHIVNAICTLCMLILVIPQVFHIFAWGLLNLPQDVEILAHQATIFMILWPGAIGYRRFYQGIMIRHNRTGRVAIGSIIRITAVATCGFSLYFWTDVPGASVGTASLVAGVVAEAIASRIMAAPTVSFVLSGSWPVQAAITPLTTHTLMKFYLPFTMTIFLGTAMQPLSTLAVGHSYLSIKSLAVLPVANAVIWFIAVSALGIQETAIVLIGNRLENFAVLRKFTLLVGITLSALLFLFAFTPLSLLWLENISGLAAELSDMAKIVLGLSFLAPVLRACECLQRSIMMKANKTHFLTVATILEILSLAFCLFMTIYVFNMTGAYGASISSIICVFISIVYLAPHTRRALAHAESPLS